MNGSSASIDSWGCVPRPSFRGQARRPQSFDPQSDRHMFDMVAGAAAHGAARATAYQAVGAPVASTKRRRPSSLPSQAMSSVVAAWAGKCARRGMRQRHCSDRYLMMRSKSLHAGPTRRTARRQHDQNGRSMSAGCAGLYSGIAPSPKTFTAPDRALSTQVNLLGRHFGLFAVRSHADEFLWNIKG
jgi:hypothetical protein